MGRRFVKNPLGNISKLTRFVPGVGPVAQMALEQASPLLQRSLAKQRHKPRSRRVPFDPRAFMPRVVRQQPSEFDDPRLLAQLQRMFPGRF